MTAETDSFLLLFQIMSLGKAASKPKFARHSPCPVSGVRKSR